MNALVQSITKLYFTGSVIGFGFTSSGIVIKGAFNKNPTVDCEYPSVGLPDDFNKPTIDLCKHPKTFAKWTLSKSAYYAIIWPVIPLMCIYEPEIFFTVGRDIDLRYFLRDKILHIKNDNNKTD